MLQLYLCADGKQFRVKLLLSTSRRLEFKLMEVNFLKRKLIIIINHEILLQVRRLVQVLYQKQNYLVWTHGVLLTKWCITDVQNLFKITKNVNLLMEKILLLLKAHHLQEKIKLIWINSAGMEIGMKENGCTIVHKDL